VLAYAATGNAPFGGGSAASILYRVVTAEPDLTGLPASLSQVITACLSKDPARRIGLPQLTAMISALGPPLPGTIGAFWPEPLASIIAADQAPHPATQVGGGPVSPGPGYPGQGTGRHSAPPAMTPSGMTPPSRIQPGPVPASTGHAPMVADGYYAAAAGNMGPASPAPVVTPTPSQPPYGQPQYGQPGAGQGWAPQYPSDPQQYAASQQPGTWQQPSAWPSEDASAQSAMPAPATLQATPWSQQPSSGGSWPGGGQPGGSGGASYPSQGTPLAQYAPGRRRPTKAELPGPVLAAARLMYLGAVVTALNIVFGNMVRSRYTKTATDYKNIAAEFAGTARGTHATAVANHASLMAADIAVVVGLGGLIGVVCWLVIAAACRRGRGWTRGAATLLLALDTIGLLVILLGTDNDPGVHVTTIIIWVMGLAATIPLWGRQARDFFAYYRR